MKFVNESKEKSVFFGDHGHGAIGVILLNYNTDLCFH